MLNQMTHNWWLVVLRGLLAIVFAVLAFFSPVVAGLVLISLFGAYAFVDGIFAFAAGITHRHTNRRWWLLLIEGILGVLVGILVFYQPGVSALFLGLFITYWIAAWAVVTGVLEIAGAFMLRQEIRNEVWMIISGVISVALGVFLFFTNPVDAAGFVIYLIIAYALIFGISQLVLGLRLRGMSGQVESSTSQPCATLPC
ncbi:MAG: HdeD family acid-resistance protein [Anaerolineaceae bacterium]|nr:HdeD family acid-resistance protein [Anaerolineaceae bacterium]